MLCREWIMYYYNFFKNFNDIDGYKANMLSGSYNTSEGSRK